MERRPDSFAGFGGMAPGFPAARYRVAAKAALAAAPRPARTADRPSLDVNLAAELQRHWLMLKPAAAHGTRLPTLIEAASGYRLTVVDDAAEMRRLVGSQGSPVDGLLIDAGPTETEGVRLCRQLRQRGTRVPVLIMGDWSNLHAVLAGLESGANDFMPRDCPPRLVAARMRCHLRTHDGSEHATFPVGGLRFHPAGRTLVEPAARRRAFLTRPENRLLQCLLKADGATVGRDLLAEQLREQSPSRDGLLDPVSKRLQQKMETMGGRVLPQRTASGDYRLARVRVPPFGTDG